MTILILDNKEEAAPYCKVLIKSNVTDTIIHSNLNGVVIATLPSGTYSISFFAFPFTSIKLDSFVIKANTKTTINTSLGNSNALCIAIIYSVRKLTDDEIAKIIDDLSNDREDNDLIKNKTCHIMWKIWQ